MYGLVVSDEPIASSSSVGAQLATEYFSVHRCHFKALNRCCRIVLIQLRAADSDVLVSTN